MRYLDLKKVTAKRDPNDPSRAKMPGGPKLGVDAKERVPYTYGGKVTPHYHVFRQLWPEPTLFKRKFGPKADVKEARPPVEHVVGESSGLMGENCEVKGSEDGPTRQSA